MVEQHTADVVRETLIDEGHAPGDVEGAMEALAKEGLELVQPPKGEMAVFTNFELDTLRNTLQ